jgi:hypothetical protein
MLRTRAKADAYNHSLFSHARRQHHTFYQTVVILNFQIAEASPNLSWTLHLARYLATLLCVLSVTRYRVHSTSYDPR